MKIHKLLPACWSLSWRMVIHCAMQLKWKVSTALGNDVLGILKGVFSGIFHKLFPTLFCNGLLFYKTARQLFWGGYYWPGFRGIEICDGYIFKCECIMYFEAIWRLSFIIYNFNSENVGDILHTPHLGSAPITLSPCPFNCKANVSIIFHFIYLFYGNCLFPIISWNIFQITISYEILSKQSIYHFLPGKFQKVQLMQIFL